MLYNQVLAPIKTAVVLKNKTSLFEKQTNKNVLLKGGKFPLFIEYKSKSRLGAEESENMSELQLRKNDYLVFIA